MLYTDENFQNQQPWKILLSFHFRPLLLFRSLPTLPPPDLPSFHSDSVWHQNQQQMSSVFVIYVAIPLPALQRLTLPSEKTIVGFFIFLNEEGKLWKENSRIWKLRRCLVFICEYKCRFFFSNEKFQFSRE